MNQPDQANSHSGGGSSARPAEDRLQDVGKDAADAAAREARARLDRGKHSAADAASRTSDALDQTASNLSAEGQETLAEMASMLSRRLSSLAHLIENRSLNDLSGDARELARRNPELFVAGGVALGLALSRFFKASGERRTARSTSASGTDAAAPAATASAAGPPASPSTPSRTSAQHGEGSNEYGGRHE